MTNKELTEMHDKVESLWAAHVEDQKRMSTLEQKHEEAAKVAAEKKAAEPVKTDATLQEVCDKLDALCTRVEAIETKLGIQHETPKLAAPAAA